MTQHDLDKIKYEALKELARRNFSDFFFYANGQTFRPLRHQLYIALYLERIANGEQLFIIVELPPQHGESTFITETFPEYSEPLFDLKIRSDTSSVSEWGIEGRLGQLYNTSILGGTTGHGFNLLIIDDPVKIRSDVESKLKRDKFYD